MISCMGEVCLLFEDDNDRYYQFYKIYLEQHEMIILVMVSLISLRMVILGVYL